MNFNELKELIALINDTDLSSFHYQKDGLKLKIEKGGAPVLAFNAAGSANAVSADNTRFENTAAPAATPATAAVPAAPAPTAPAAAQSGGTEVKSPLVGVFYASPTPDSAPFVTVGQRVKKGDVLCIVEAMKVMNEIVSEWDGIVQEISAVNESLVEYGQTLIKIGQ